MMGKSGQSDACIVGQVLGGERQRFSLLVERYLPVVHAVAYVHLGNHTDAEDIAQDAFLKAFQSLDTLREYSSFGPWLITITKNKCRDLGVKRNREVPLSEHPEPVAGSVSDLDREELHKLLRTQIQQLDEKHRDVLLMHYFAGKTTREIAVLLGITAAAAEKRLQRARDTLGRKLIDELGAALAPETSTKERVARTMAAIATIRVPWLTVGPTSTSPVAGSTAQMVSGLITTNKFLVGSIVVVLTAVSTWMAVEKRQRGVQPLGPRISASTSGIDLNQALNPDTNAPAFAPSDEPIEPVDYLAESAHEEDAKTLTAGVISGRVYDGDAGHGIAEAKIRAKPIPYRTDMPSGEAETDDSGNYHIDGLGESQYRVYLAWVEGYQHAKQWSEKRVEVRFDSPNNDVDFSLSKGIQVTGTVIDHNGLPVAAAKVSIDSMQALRGDRVTCDEYGAFEIAGLTPIDDLYLQPIKQGLALRPQGPFSLTEEGLHGITLTMSPAASIEGRVVNPAGEPLVGMEVSVGSEDVGSYGGLKTKPADEDGNFKISGLFAGTYSFCIAHAGESRFRRINYIPPFSVGPGDEMTDVLVVYEDDTYTIAGRVTNTDGEPVVGAEIVCSGPARYPHATSGSDGAFRVRVPVNGLYTVRVTHETYGAVTVESVAAGSDGVEIVLGKSGTVEGQVVHAHTGEPVTDFLLTDPKSRPEVAEGRRLISVLDMDGRFHLTGIDRPEMTIHVEAPGFISTSEVVSGIQPEKTISGVVLRLEPASPIRGMVTNTGGEPVVGANIFFDSAPPEVFQSNFVVSKSDLAGTFYIDRIPAKFERMCADHTDYAPACVDVDPRRTESELVEIVLTSGCSIEGIVTVNGEPIPDQAVHIQPLERYSRTDENGRYAITKLAAGEVSVFVGRSIGSGDGQVGRTHTRTVVLEDGEMAVVDFDLREWDTVLEGVVKVNGQPPGPSRMEVRVTFDDSDFDENMYYAYADELGYYRVEGVRPGSASVEAFARFPGGKHRGGSAGSVEILDGEPTRLDIDFAD